MNYTPMSHYTDTVIEEIIADIMFMFPKTSRRTAELSAVTMIRNPKMLIELNEMVKEKRMLEIQDK
jgi:hypothetical protein